MNEQENDYPLVLSTKDTDYNFLKTVGLKSTWSQTDRQKHTHTHIQTHQVVILNHHYNAHWSPHPHLFPILSSTAASLTCFLKV